jgi:predicted transposase/invertase (TIGR01784 family)
MKDDNGIKVSERFIDPFLDHSFKIIFGSEENKLVLIDFLNKLLKGERQIEDVQFMNKEQVEDREYSRAAIYDVFCKDKNGEYFIVEMQNDYQANFVKRMVYYSSECLVHQAEVGGDWEFNLKPVYCIAFTNFTNERRIGNDVVERYAICNTKTGKTAVDNVLNLIFIQLPLFNKSVDECENDFEKWLYVLKNMDVLERLPKTFNCEAFRKLREISDVSKLSEADRLWYKKTQRDYWDLKGVIEGAEEKGVERGMEKGITQGKLAVARNLKKMKISPNVISSATGLSIDEINAIDLN